MPARILIEYDNQREQYKAYDKDNPGLAEWDNSPSLALNRLMGKVSDEETAHHEEEKSNLTLYVSKSIKDEYLELKHSARSVFQRHFIDDNIIRKGITQFRNEHSAAFQEEGEKRPGVVRRLARRRRDEN